MRSPPRADTAAWKPSTAERMSASWSLVSEPVSVTPRACSVAATIVETRSRSAARAGSRSRRESFLGDGALIRPFLRQAWSAGVACTSSLVPPQPVQLTLQPVEYRLLHHASFL